MFFVENDPSKPTSFEDDVWERVANGSASVSEAELDQVAQQLKVDEPAVDSSHDGQG